MPKSNAHVGVVCQRGRRERILAIDRASAAATGSPPSDARPDEFAVARVRPATVSRRAPDGLVGACLGARASARSATPFPTGCPLRRPDDGPASGEYEVRDRRTLETRFGVSTRLRAAHRTAILLPPARGSAGRHQDRALAYRPERASRRCRPRSACPPERGRWSRPRIAFLGHRAGARKRIGCWDGSRTRRQSFS